MYVCVHVHGSNYMKWFREKYNESSAKQYSDIKKMRERDLDVNLAFVWRPASESKDSARLMRVPWKRWVLNQNLTVREVGKHPGEEGGGVEGEETIGTKGPELDFGCYAGDRIWRLAFQKQNSPGNKGVITFWNQPDVRAFTLHQGVWIYYKWWELVLAHPWVRTSESGVWERN